MEASEQLPTPSPKVELNPHPVSPDSHNHLPFIIIVISLVLGVVFVMSLYLQTQTKKQTSLNPTPSFSPVISSSKKLIVGTDPTLPPMEYLENGNLVGYDIDLSRYIAKELGKEVEFKNILFDDLFTALDNKQIDIIISAVTVTPERQATYNFSTEYLNAGQVIITRRADNSINSTTDLKGKKIGTQKGTTNETEALKYTSANLVIRYPDFVQATQALINSNVDAIFTDLPNAKGITLANPTLKIAGDPFTHEYYAVVFRRDDPTVNQVNNALSALRAKGILTQLKQKWLD